MRASLHHKGWKTCRFSEPIRSHLYSWPSCLPSHVPRPPEHSSLIPAWVKEYVPWETEGRALGHLTYFSPAMEGAPSGHESPTGLWESQRNLDGHVSTPLRRLWAWAGGRVQENTGSPSSPEWPGSGLFPWALGWLPTPPRSSEEMKGWNVASFLLPAGLQEIEKFSFNEELRQEVRTTVISRRPWSMADGSEEAGLFGGTLWGPAEARVASPSAPSTSSKPPGPREESRRDEGGEPRGSHGATKS